MLVHPDGDYHHSGYGNGETFTNTVGSLSILFRKKAFKNPQFSRIFPTFGMIENPTENTSICPILRELTGKS